jgi:hypothetical protein
MRAASDASRAITSGAPKILESLLAQFGVAGGVLDGAMPKPILNCSRVVLEKAECDDDDRF